MLYDIELQENTQYLYSTAVIRALEKKLLNDNDFVNLLDVKLNSLIPSLSEHGYNVDNIFTFEELYENEIKKLNKMNSEITDSNFMKLVQLENDITLLKILLKRKFILQYNKEDIFEAETGYYSFENMLSMVYDLDFKVIEDNPFTGIIEKFEKMDDKSSIKIEDELDKFYYSYSLELAKKIKSKFLVKLIELKITLLNVKNLIRLKEEGGEFHFLRNYLLSDSFFDESFYLSMWDTDSGSYANLFLKEDWYHLVKPVFEEYSRNGSLSIIEREFDNILVRFMRESTKNLISSIDVIYSYYNSKIIELKNIKIIYIGKVNHLSKDLIIKSLRKTYV